MVVVNHTGPTLVNTLATPRDPTLHQTPCKTDTKRHTNPRRQIPRDLKALPYPHSRERGLFPRVPHPGYVTVHGFQSKHTSTHDIILCIPTQKV